MGFFTDLLGGPGKTREFGGGFDKAIKPYAEEGLTDLQSIYRGGPRVFQGQRVEGFDPLQTQAQEGLISLLGTTDPYTQRQQDLLESSIAGIGGYEAGLGRAEGSLGRGVGFLEDFSRGLGRAEASMGKTGELLTGFETGLGRTEESLGRSLGFLEDFRGQAGEAQRRLEGVEPGLTRTEALLAESAQRQRDAARGVGLGELDVDRYRSDYMTAVADPALADVERQLQMDLRKLGAQESQYGQGRGSRGAILEAELRGAAGRSRADILGQVGKEAYQSALDTAQRQQAAQYGADVSDVDRQARAAAALAGLGQAEQAAAIGGRGTLAGMYGDVAGRSLAGAGQAGDITRQLAGITGQRLAGVSQADALTSQLAGIAGQRLGAAGQATGISGQALDVARAGGAVPGMYSDIAGQFGGLGESAFGRRRTELETLGGVGTDRRTLEQQRTLAEMAKFAEEDPFGFTQRYLQTIYAAPTRQTQYSQDPSTFQELMGIGALAGSFMGKAEGGKVHKDMGGAILKMLMSSGGGKKKTTTEDIDKVMDSVGPTILNEGGGILNKMKSMYNKTSFSNDMTKEEEEEIKDIEDFSDKNFGTDYASERESGEKKGITPANAMASVGSKRIKADDSVMFSKQRAARQALGMRQNGGGIASLQAGGVPSTIEDLQKGLRNPAVLNQVRQQMNSGNVSPIIPRPNIEAQNSNEPNAFQRILSGVGSGLQSIGSGIKTGAEYYANNLDPFGPAGANLTRAERIQVGLGILAAQPTLGESPLTTTARGALGAIGQLPENDTITLRTSPVPSSEYEDIDKGVIGLQGIESKAGADIRAGLRREAEIEAINKVKAGTLSNDPASYRTEVLRIYKKKVEDKFGKNPSAGDTGNMPASNTRQQPNGSASSAFRKITTN
jgi:hypothetical protein